MEHLPIYDDAKFFKNYLELRKARYNYNDLIEQPLIFDLLGDLSGKEVIDIGCGYGAMSKRIAEHGAKKVLGLDNSEKMIQKACEEYGHACVSYRTLPMEQLSEITDEYDVVVSCLAIHYVENLYRLFSDIYRLTKTKGSFVFSMEHPMYTASMHPQHWISDSNNQIVAFATDHYGVEGKREIEWLGKPVLKFHHKMETVINALIKSGFVIEQILEPTPTPDMLKMVPKTIHEIHRPAYLIAKCHKA